MNKLIRIQVLKDAGFGGLNQVKMPASIVGTDKCNYNIYLSNVGDMDENFVIFLRKSHDPACDCGKLDVVGIYNTGDLIYDLIYRKYINMGQNDRLIVEIDCSGAPFVQRNLFSDPVFDPNQAAECSLATHVKLLFDYIREHDNGRVRFSIIFRDYTPIECQTYFFPECDRVGTLKCCKMARSKERSK